MPGGPKSIAEAVGIESVYVDEKLLYGHCFYITLQIYNNFCSEADETQEL